MARVRTPLLSTATLQALATLSYVLVALAVLAVGPGDLLGPYAKARLLAVTMALAMTAAIALSLRREERWQDWAALVLVAFLARLMTNFTSGTLTFIQDAEIHLTNHAENLFRTGHTPDPREVGTLGGYEDYPIIHFILVTASHWADVPVFPMSSVLGATLGVVTGLVAAAFAQATWRAYGLATLGFYAFWSSALQAQAYYQPITLGILFTASILLLLDRARQPRALVLLFVTLVALIFTHHYSSTVGALCIMATLLVPLLTKDLGRWRLLRPRRTPSEQLQRWGWPTVVSVPFQRVGLAFIVFLGPFLYSMLVGGQAGTFASFGDSLANFLGIRDVNTERVAAQEALRLSNERVTPLALNINRFTVLPPLGLVSFSLLLAALTRQRMSYGVAAGIGFSMIFILTGTTGLLAGRVLGFMSVPGAVILAYAASNKWFTGRLKPLFMFGILLTALFNVSSIEAMNFMQPWTRNEPFNLNPSEPDYETFSVALILVPKETIPGEILGLSTLVFSTMGLPLGKELNAGSPPWLWPPRHFGPAALNQYYVLDDEALEFGSRKATLARNFGLEGRELIVRYPTLEMDMLMDRSRRVMDSGDVRMWYPTFF
ncbi:MAG: hypothetical protein ACPGQL_03745 [Thermoplasmatota archaeon]